MLHNSQNVNFFFRTDIFYREYTEPLSTCWEVFSYGDENKALLFVYTSKGSAKTNKQNEVVPMDESSLAHTQWDYKYHFK